MIDALGKRIAHAASAGPPGLIEQHKLQLEMLKNPDLPDIEIVVFPFNMQPTG